MFQRIFIIVLFFGTIYFSPLYSEEKSSFDFNKIEQFDKAAGLPSLYFGGGFDIGKYRESDYSQMLYGFNMFIGLPVDRVLSAECYADIQFHSPNETASTFWKGQYGLRSIVDLQLSGFRILSAGGRLRFLFFRHWEWLVGGGIGIWGFNPVLNDVAYGRYDMNLYEVLIATGFSKDISEKWFINARITFKKYYLELANNHEMAVIFGLSVGYRWFRK